MIGAKTPNLTRNRRTRFILFGGRPHDRVLGSMSEGIFCEVRVWSHRQPQPGEALRRIDGRNDAAALVLRITEHKMSDACDCPMGFWQQRYE